MNNLRADNIIEVLKCVSCGMSRKYFGETPKKPYENCYKCAGKMKKMESDSNGK